MMNGNRVCLLNSAACFNYLRTYAHQQNHLSVKITDNNNNDCDGDDDDDDDDNNINNNNK